MKILLFALTCLALSAAEICQPLTFPKNMTIINNEYMRCFNQNFEWWNMRVTGGAIWCNYALTPACKKLPNSQWCEYTSSLNITDYQGKDFGIRVCLPRDCELERINIKTIKCY